MKRVLITGVTGQDGTYLARELLTEGVEVHGTLRPESVSLVEPGVNSHRLNLTDRNALEQLVRDLKPSEVYHLAGQTSVAASWEDPLETIQQTGLPTAVLLQAIAKYSPETRIVNASSAEIFGLAKAPQNESAAIRPVSPYGSAKALGYFLVENFRSRGLHASSCILYNHESPLRSDRFVSRKITRAVAEISQGLAEKLVLGNLEASRDWGWAPDYVRALRLVAAQPEAADYVIGTGESHTVAEFVEVAFEAVGIRDWKSYVTTDASLLRPSDGALQLADSTLAKSRLGWKPTVSFTQIVTKMVQADLAELTR